LYALGGRYYDLYTKQHGIETNLFLAPGEGDVLTEEPATAQREASRWQSGRRPPDSQSGPLSSYLLQFTLLRPLTGKRSAKYYALGKPTLRKPMPGAVADKLSTSGWQGKTGN